MFDLSQVATNKDLVSDGVWVEDVLPTIDVKMRSTSCHAFKELGQALMKPYDTIGKTPSTEDQEKIAARSFAESIVMDWRQKKEDGTYLDGVMLDGELLKYSPKVGYEVFTKIGVFLEAVAKQSNNIANFKERVNKDLAGN
jgi:hypothetical protein